MVVVFAGASTLKCTPPHVPLLNADAIAYIRKGVGADQLSKTLADALAVKSGLPARATA